MGLLSEQLAVAQLVQECAKDEGFITESEIEQAACRAVERIFERLERHIEMATAELPPVRS